MKQRGNSFRRKNDRKLRVERAKKEISSIFSHLGITYDIDLKRAYIKHIRAISQKVQITLPPQIKNSFCRRCSEIFTLTPKPTFSVRIRRRRISYMVYTCRKCGYIRRIPIKQKKILEKRHEVKENVSKAI